MSSLPLLSCSCAVVADRSRCGYHCGGFDALCVNLASYSTTPECLGPRCNTLLWWSPKHSKGLWEGLYGDGVGGGGMSTSQGACRPRREWASALRRAETEVPPKACPAPAAPGQTAARFWVLRSDRLCDKNIGNALPA